MPIIDIVTERGNEGVARIKDLTTGIADSMLDSFSLPRSTFTADQLRYVVICLS